MTIYVKHSLPGRLRLNYPRFSITSKQAVLVESLITVQEGITSVESNPAASTFLIYYDTQKITEKEIINLFKVLDNKYLEDESLLAAVNEVPETESIFGVFVKTLLGVAFRRLCLPIALRNIWLYLHIIPRVGLVFKSLGEGRIFSTELLDAVALTVSVATGNQKTASSVSTLLSMGDQIEEITRIRSYGNLAQTLMIKEDSVRAIKDGEETVIPFSELKKDDLIIVRTGGQIPVDGTVESGDGSVNQSSITGESLPVVKNAGASVFAGTILEEGELIIRVRTIGSDTKVNNIISMIDRSQSLKASVQRRSEAFAERIVPFNFLLTGLTWLFTRNLAKTISTLMVDYSCAMKLSAPISVLSAMKEAALNEISVKGGKYLEEVALADTVIFDKTGTLTYANPVLVDIYPMEGFDSDEVLSLAACLEEHFPHPLGRAVVKAAEEKNLVHPEKHAKVEYIVAHGIASMLDEKKLRIGSSHFIFEDEGVPTSDEVKEIQKMNLKNGNSLLYLSVDGKLAGILAIGDPVRPDAKEAIDTLRSLGVKKCVMITGDTEGAAQKIAKQTGLDAWCSQALPEDKVTWVQKECDEGRRVMMIGDGINDAPALSAANVGIAIDGCASIAGDTADIVLSGGGLKGLVLARTLGQRLISKINLHNRIIVGVNSVLLFGGILGFVSPALAALLHNSLTVAISLKSMDNLLDENKL